MIFRLSLTGRSFDSELAKIRTQAGERSLVQESGQVIGSVRQQFSASEADEEIEILSLDALARGAARRLRERGMLQAERTCIAAQRGETLEQCAVGRACEQHRQQPVFLGTPGVDVIDVAARGLVTPVEVRAQDRPVHAGRGLNRKHPLGGNAGPVRYGRL